MKYTEGYLAFLDILGFSNFVRDESNGQETEKLFEFIKKFCYLFNTSPQLDVNVSFFSDTIIITSKELSKLQVPICISEIYLKSTLGLLFRGGIVYGKYYHKDGSTFGPAVIEGYKLEKQAVYSRILIADNIPIKENDLMFFVDVDGQKCLNPYGILVFEPVINLSKESSSKIDINKLVIENFSTLRNELLLQINKYKGSSVVDKYLWRVRAYNSVCRLILKLPEGEVISSEHDYKINSSLKEHILQMIISENDIFHFNNSEMN